MIKLKHGGLIFKISVSIIFLAIILYKVDLARFFETLKSFSPWILFVFPLFTAAAIIINTYNIYILLRALNTDIRFTKVLDCYISAWLFGKVSTGKSGEMSVIYFLTKKNVDYPKGIVVVFVDRVLSLLFLLPLFVISGLYLLRDKADALILIATLAILVITAAIIFYNQVTYLIKKYLLRKYSVYFRDFTVNLKYLIHTKKRYLFLNFFATFLKQVNAALCFFIIFLALSTYIPPINVFLISSIESGVSQLPISWSGIGVSEGTAIYLYGGIGIASYVVLSVYLFNRLYSYVVSLLIYFLRPLVKFLLRVN